MPDMPPQHGERRGITSCLRAALPPAVDPRPPRLQREMEGERPRITASADGVSGVHVHDADAPEINPRNHQRMRREKSCRASQPREPDKPIPTTHGLG